MELHVYDFDGTLFRSPEEPSWWPKNTYWWTSPDSLGRPCVPDHPDNSWWVSSVVSQAKKSISNPNVIAIICTGRSDVGSNRYRIPELFKQAGLSFDGVYLNPSISVKTHKSTIVSKYLNKYPEIDTVHMWDDTKLNLDEVRDVASKFGRIFIPHIVKVPPKEPLCTEKSYQNDNPYVSDPIDKIANRWIDSKKG